MFQFITHIWHLFLYLYCIKFFHLKDDHENIVEPDNNKHEYAATLTSLYISQPRTLQNLSLDYSYTGLVSNFISMQHIIAVMQLSGDDTHET